jgi:hypothetical protein
MSSSASSPSGYEMTEPVRSAILGMGEIGWRPAIRQDGSKREGAQVLRIG